MDIHGYFGWEDELPSFSKKKKMVEKYGRKLWIWSEIEATCTKTTVARQVRPSEMKFTIVSKLVNSKLKSSFHVFFRFRILFRINL